MTPPIPFFYPSTLTYCPPPQFVPRWVAPNLLTFTGWLMVMFNFALLSYYDPDYLTSYNTVGVVRPPIPRWVWLFCGVSHFISYTLDGIDGKQARRTGSATPLGKLSSVETGLCREVVLVERCFMCGRIRYGEVEGLVSVERWS